MRTFYIGLLILFNLPCFAQDFIDLLKPYESSGLEFKAGNSLRICNDKTTQLPIPEKIQPEKLSPTIRKECLPDTLYSWGTIEKAKAILDELEINSDWGFKLKRPLFTSPFPAATFPYGAIPIRIKLKPDLKFVRQADFCPPKLNKRNSNSVYYANKLLPGVGSLYEIVICSADVIESISYGTREHYDEVIRDIVWSTTPGREKSDYYTYIQAVGGKKVSPNINFEEEPFFQFANGVVPRNPHIDGHEVSKEALHKHLSIFKEYVDKTGGRVIYNQNGLENNHFSTTLPMYFNPY